MENNTKGRRRSGSTKIRSKLRLRRGRQPNGRLTTLPPITTIDLNALPPIWTLVADDGTEASVIFEVPTATGHAQIALHANGPDLQWHRVIAAIHEIQDGMRSRLAGHVEDQPDGRWYEVERNRETLKAAAEAAGERV